jgi:glycylpeptide N-tetradecanoyltransferase
MKTGFWNTQPVSNKNTKEYGPIDTSKDICQEPYNLPDGFSWVTINLDTELNDVYNLLSNHYVEDTEGTIRFDYSKEFLLWALKPPGYIKDWHVGVRGSNGKLYGFITGIPVKVHIGDDTMMMAEINFLCVHHVLRSKKLAPVLIREITRRVNLLNIWQAVYTAGVKLFEPTAVCQYWHRALRPKKLIDIGFMGLSPQMTLARIIKLYKLPSETSNMRSMKPEDIPQVCKFLNTHLKSKTKLWIEWSEEETAH